MRPYLKKTINTYNTYSGLFAKNRKDFALKDFIALFASLLHGKKILEIGCGPGRDARVFVDKGYDVTGLDLSEELLKIAKEQAPEAEFILGDMLELPFDSAQFDGIWCAATLHHLKLQDMPLALSEMHRVLKPKGAAFISTKTGENQEAHVPEEEFDGAERFYTYLEAPTFRELLEQAGFKIHTFKTITTKELFPDFDPKHPRLHQAFHDAFVVKE